MSKTFLHICLTEAWGGLEMAVSRWNSVLKEAGHYNINICTPDSPLSRDLKEQEARVIEWESAHYFAPDFTWKLRKLLQQTKVDHILLQNLRDLWIVSPALWKIKNTQLIGFAQMLTGVKKTDFLHRQVYKPLSNLLTLTDWQQGELQKYLPVPAKKYATIPNFVDTQIFHPSKRSEDFRYQLGFNPDDFVIGIIGRIDEQKGQKELIRAFAKIHPQFPKAHLLIVGEPTRGQEKQELYFKKLQQVVQENKLQNRVHFKGFQKDTSLITANFDLFVLSSYRETFGYVVVEAMASGTPVLATNTGGPPEILGHGEYGWLCKPQDHDSMAETLKEILEDANARQKKANAALNRAREFYDRKQVCQRFLKLIRTAPLNC